MTTNVAPQSALVDVRPFAQRRRRPADVIFHGLVLGAVLIALAALAWLLVSVLRSGLAHLTWDFLTSKATNNPAKSGFTSAIRGSVVLMFYTALVALPLGFGAAIYLEKFATERSQRATARALVYAEALQTAVGPARVMLHLRRAWARCVGPLNRLVEVNISNLAAVPSIIYGLLGLAVFIAFAGLRESLLAGGLTLALLVLPIIIIASREAIRAVPISIEQGALALGATRWQAVRSQVVPAALSGMLTGSILAMSRAIGESAPLIVVGGVVFSTQIPSVNPVNANSEALVAMPLQAFFWAGQPRQEFHELAAAGIIVLMAVLLLMNAVAILLRNRYGKRW